MAVVVIVVLPPRVIVVAFAVAARDLFV